MFTVLVTLIQFGIASVYTDHQVACPGERYNARALTAAHRTLPCGSRVEVTNLRNGRKVVVKITDRGPCLSKECQRQTPWLLARVIDLTPEAARQIGMDGLAPVSVARLK